VDLKARLRFIEQQQAGFKPQSPRPPGRPIDEILPGEIRHTPLGSCFVRSERFPLSHLHGEVRLAAALQISTESLTLVAKDPRFSSVNLADAVFLDTETTGLSGGVGTCAFLIGIGYFADGQFFVDQYFMRDFHEEPACLYLVNERISRAATLVSYNGKSFDLPILRSRTITSRLETSLDSLLHIDLLYTARRLWKHRLISCSLSQVEQHVVGFQRYGDIPGELVPQLYFDYLNSGDAAPLTRVFTHNRDDVLSLVALAAKACQAYERPREFASHPRDALAVGKTLEAMNRTEQTAEVYRTALDTQGSPHEAAEVALRLAACYKRMGRWTEAVDQWRRVIQMGEFNPLPYVELAKYYEHRARDYVAAREIVHRALAAVEVRQRLRPSSQDARLRDELLHRLRRIERKLDRAKKCPL
jgi:uncharacterized protein YprB with RNaseH-like and TPR domain